MFKVNSKDTRTKWIDAVAVSFAVISKIFKNTYFEKHLPTAASVDGKNFYSATESQTEMKFE